MAPPVCKKFARVARAAATLSVLKYIGYPSGVSFINSENDPLGPSIVKGQPLIFATVIAFSFSEA